MKRTFGWEHVDDTDPAEFKYDVRNPTASAEAI
jgi:hypothetical protein